MVFQDHDRLLRQSVFLMAATQVGNVANVLFQMVLNHRLPDAEYGILASMLGLIVMVATPLDALRTAVAHFSARYCQAGYAGQIRELVGGWSKTMAAIAVVIIAAAAIGNSYLSRFFQLPSPIILMAASVVMAGTLFMPSFAGALQGTQAFGWLAVSGQSWGIVRLLVGTVLVISVSATALMGLLAQGMGVLASIILGWLGLSLVVKAKPRGIKPMAGGLSYFVKSLLVLSGYAILVNADVCMVKHYFSPDEAGIFARAATIARGIIFLPMPIAGVMFPKVVSEGLISELDRKTLFRAFSFAGVVILSACLLCSVLAGLIWFVFVGQWPNADSLYLLRLLLWAMAPLGLTYLMLNFELAQRRFYWPWMIILCAVGYIGGVMLWHQSVWQVVAVMAVMNLTSLGWLGFGMPWRNRKGVATLQHGWKS